MKNPIQFPWPKGGVDKAKSWRDQTPDTCISASNVRNIDCLDGRLRGGTRPGLAREYATQLGSGNPVRMLGRVAVAKDTTRFRWADDFNRDTLGDSWSTASWIGTATPCKAALDGVYADNSTNGIVAQALNFSTSSAYTVEIYVVPWLGAFWGSVKLFARMDNTTPVATTDGVVLTLTHSSLTYSGTLVSYVAGVATSYALSGGTSTAAPGWLRLHVNSNTCTVTWQGTQLLSQAVSAHTGKRLGLGMTCTAAYPTGIGLIDVFRVLGAPLTAADAPDYAEYLCAISNGSLSYSSSIEVMTAASGDSNDFTTNRNLRCAELFQKLYIADWSEVKVSGSAATTDGAGTQFDDAAVSDWTALSLDKDTDVVVISSGTGATAGTYEFTTIHSTNGLTLTSSAGSSASAIAYRVARCPKIFDPSTKAVTKWVATSGKGQVPNECPLIAVFGDRVYLGGAAYAPHVWYASRRADPLDWDYAQTDSGRAVAGTTAGSAGTIGLPLSAMFTASNDNLIMASKTTMMVLRGDPAAGGRFDSLSTRVGIIDAGAWAKGPEDETYFLSRDGVYLMPPGESSNLQNLSRLRLPNDLIDVNSDLYHVLMMYNVRQQGVHIWLTYRTGVPVSGWFFDVKRAAFWPETLPSTKEVFSAVNLQVNTIAQSELLLGCRDGYLRRYSSTSQTDDGTSITSNAYLGPYRLSGTDFARGQLLELDGILDRDGGPLTWDVYVGDDHETVWNASSAATGTWSATGQQYRRRPMVSGGSMILKLTNYNARPWALEKAFGVVKPSGRMRLA